MTSSLQRVLVGLLILLFVLVFVRFQQQRQVPSNAIVLQKLKPHRLYQRTFELQEAAPVYIESTGSFGSDTVLAAYSWLVSLPDQRLRWRMDPLRVRRKGTLAMASDTLHLPAGTYRIYMTTLGDPEARTTDETVSVWEQLEHLFGRDIPWTRDAGHWFVRVEPLQGAWRLLPRGFRLPRPDTTRLREIGPLGNDRYEHFWFSVQDTLPVEVEVQGEWRASEQDRGFLEVVRTGMRPWEMRPQNTVHAGGALRNRKGRATVVLPPGIYRTAFHTGPAHAYAAWEANPPHNPTFWGLRLHPSRKSATFEPVDPWRTFPVLVRLAPAGDDAYLHTSFRLDRPTRVLIYALGEGSRSRLYDRGWIVDQRTGARIWEMKPDSTWHAGGARKNRKAITTRTLLPGTYTAFYQTDDSHAAGNWNSDPPDEPERWGLTVLVLDTLQAHEAFSATGEGEAVLVDLTRLGNNASVSARFTLEDTTRVVVQAVGELLPSQRADYGWITRADSDVVVWEMTRQNTVHAGGSYKNRLARDTLTLPPGTYIVHFRTDDSHAFGAFNAEPPANPDAWGIRVWKVDTARNPASSGQ